MPENTSTLELGVPHARDADTLELPVTTAAERESHLEAPAPRFAESEPTTMALPMTSGGGTLVLEELPPGARSPESLELSPRRARMALVVLAAGAFGMSANEASIVALSGPIASGLGVPVASVGLLATAFAVTVLVATIPLTLVTGRLSKRATLTATFAVWTVGVLLAATASSLPELAAGRVVSAAAHALFWAIVAPTAASLFAPHLRAHTVTRIMVGAATSGVIGTPLVTLAGQSVGWRVPYFALGVIGVVLAVAVAAAMPRASFPRKDRAPVQHTRGDLPSRRLFLRVLVVTFLATIGVTTTWTYIVPFYTGVASIPRSAVPVLFALGGIVAVTATLGVSRFLTQFAVETVATGLVMIVSAWALLATGSKYAAIAGQVLVSAGWAVLLAALLSWAMRHTPWRTDMGAATYTVALNSGAAIGPLLGAALVTTWGTRSLPLASIGLTVLALIVTVTVDRTTLRMLHVPRRVRVALASRAALRARRLEWQRRTGRRARCSVAAAWSVGQQAARATGHGTAHVTRHATRHATKHGSKKATSTAGATASHAGRAVRPRR